MLWLRKNTIQDIQRYIIIIIIINNKITYYVYFELMLKL